MNFLQFALAGVINLFHPFFISMTDINHNVKNKTLEVSVRIFTDDFEKTLKQNCNCKVDLINPGNKGEMEKLASNYIMKHLQVKIDGQPVPLQFAGYQQEEGSIWSYFEIKNVASLKKLELQNTLLYDFSESQVNMIHIKANGNEKNDKLDFPKNTYSITW